MRKNDYIKALLLSALTVSAAITVFAKSAECTVGIRDGLRLCASTVIPSLFPFLIVSQFTVHSGMSDFIGSIMKKPARLIFGLPGICSPVIFMSLIGGFPVGAKMSSELLESGKISRHTAARLNLFCINAGPAFIIGTVGRLMLSSTKAGILLYISTVLSSHIIGVLTRFLKGTKNEAYEDSDTFILKSPVTALISSLKSSVYTMLSVCAWITVFSAFTRVLISLNHGIGMTVICAVSEVTGGVKLTAGLFSLPVIAAIIGFGGVCVHCQVLSYVQKSGLGLFLFLASRTVSAALSAVICKGLITLFPCETETFASISAVTADSFSVSLPSAAALIIMCALLIFEVDTNKKMC